MKNYLDKSEEQKQYMYGNIPEYTEYNGTYDKDIYMYHHCKMGHVSDNVLMEMMKIKR